MTEKPIRVLQVIGIMNRGGAENMIMNLYRNIDRTRIQFDFVESNIVERAAFDDEIEQLGGTIYRCPHFKGSNFIEYQKWWNDFFEKHESTYSIVHGHIGSSAAIYLSIAKKKGIFTIAHSHNTSSNKNIKHLMYSAFSYPTRNIADYFFACSQAAGMDRYGKKIALGSRNYKVFPNAIECEHFSYNLEIRNKIRDTLKIEKNDFVIGHVGRFMTQKNHRFLIEIFAAVLDKKPNTKLLLVGGGELFDEIQSYSKQMGVFDKVIFTGVTDQVSQYMQAMDVFVFPSLFEGLPLTMVEAQTSGIRCFISDRVPAECILTNNLVSIIKLSDNADRWAEEILSASDYQREDCTDIIRKKGFDVKETTKWIQEFYLKNAK